MIVENQTIDKNMVSNILNLLDKLKTQLTASDFQRATRGGPVGACKLDDETLEISIGAIFTCIVEDLFPKDKDW